MTPLVFGRTLLYNQWHPAFRTQGICLRCYTNHPYCEVLYASASIHGYIKYHSLKNAHIQSFSQQRLFRTLFPCFVITAIHGFNTTVITIKTPVHFFDNFYPRFKRWSLLSNGWFKRCQKRQDFDRISNFDILV